MFYVDKKNTVIWLDAEAAELELERCEQELAGRSYSFANRYKQLTGTSI